MWRVEDRKGVLYEGIRYTGVHRYTDTDYTHRCIKLSSARADLVKGDAKVFSQHLRVLAPEGLQKTHAAETDLHLEASLLNGATQLPPTSPDYIVPSKSTHYNHTHKQIRILATSA